MEQETKRKIRELENKRANAINSKQLTRIKEKKIRKYLLTNIFIALGLHIIGLVFFPLLCTIAILYNCLHVITLGTVIIHFEGKEEKLQKEIDVSDEEIAKLENKLKTHKLEQIPTSQISLNKEIPQIIKETKLDKNKKL